MNDKVNKPLETYRVLTSITRKAQQLSKQDQKYITEFNLPISSKKVKNKTQVIDSYFDKLNEQVLEYTFLELFANFEAVVLEKISNASGNMSSILSERYEYSEFNSFTGRFIKTEKDFGSLNRILILLENKISADLYADLKNMVKYRDRLAHGKRFNHEIILDNLEESRNVLTKILEEIS
jgi:hypothetical protein